MIVLRKLIKFIQDDDKITLSEDSTLYFLMIEDPLVF